MMTLIEAANELNLANNGYTFVSNMSPEFVRQAERLVARSAFTTAKFYRMNLRNAAGKLEAAYLTEKAYNVYKPGV